MKEAARNIAVIAVNDEGAEMAALIAAGLPAEIAYSSDVHGGPGRVELHLKGSAVKKTGNQGSEIRRVTFERLSEHIRNIFHKYQGFVFVMSAGIVNRVIAPLLTDKYTDPAVVTHDELGRYVISTLSGHEGGANELAYRVSSVTGAAPVVTTATEANRAYTCGVGCRRGASGEKIVEAIAEACRSAGISTGELRCIASAWVKSDEQGLREAAKDLGLYLRFIPKWMIEYYYETFPGAERSDFVYRKVGVHGVSEPSAILAGRNTELLLKKRAYNGVTVAISKERFPHRGFGIRDWRLGNDLTHNLKPLTSTLVLGGTAEAMEASSELLPGSKDFYISTATEYGYELFRESFGERVFLKRFSEDSLGSFIKEKNVDTVIDCTHPYARIITATALKVCGEVGVEYISRVRDTELSEDTDYEKVISVSSMKEAVDRIRLLGIKRPLFTTGSKDLSFAESLTGSELYVRVLPYEDSIKLCMGAGIRRSNIIAMHGPFSRELNIGIMKQFGIDCMVTRKSGSAGGFNEKIRAAEECGIWCVVIKKAKEGV